MIIHKFERVDDREFEAKVFGSSLSNGRLYYHRKMVGGCEEVFQWSWIVEGEQHSDDAVGKMIRVAGCFKAYKIKLMDLDDWGDVGQKVLDYFLKNKVNFDPNNMLYYS